MKLFWKNKRVLITGASGFVGSYLTTMLLKNNADVSILIDKPLSKNSIIVKSGQNRKLKKIFIADVADTQTIKKIFEENKFNYCFHLAAQSLVEPAGGDPLKTFETNIKGTWNILEATRQNKLMGTVIASTAHVYGRNALPLLEEYFPRPTRPYETSKACADIISQTYATYFNLPVAIARFVNIYGPGDANTRLVPKTISQLLNNKPPELFADTTTRDYMYVEDAINAYVALAEYIPRFKKKKSQNIIFNFGTGEHHKNNEIVKKIMGLMKKSHLIPKQLAKTRKYEILKQYVSIEKARLILGWQPIHSLSMGLKKTIEWYQNQEK